MLPSDTTLKTSPRALICAATQPKYDTTMQRIARTSTVRPYFSRKKSPIVSMRRLYRWRAKDRPTKIKHREDPNGSETTPPKPSFKSYGDAQYRLGANPSSKYSAVTMGMGRLCPAAAKSAVFLTRKAAHKPMPTDTT